MMNIFETQRGFVGLSDKPHHERLVLVSDASKRMQRQDCLTKREYQIEWKGFAFQKVEVDSILDLRDGFVVVFKSYSQKLWILVKLLFHPDIRRYVQAGTVAIPMGRYLDKFVMLHGHVMVLHSTSIQLVDWKKGTVGSELPIAVDEILPLSPDTFFTHSPSGGSLGVYRVVTKHAETGTSTMNLEKVWSRSYKGIWRKVVVAQNLLQLAFVDQDDNWHVVRIPEVID